VHLLARNRRELALGVGAITTALLHHNNTVHSSSRTLTMKDVRRRVEEDLGLPRKALDECKDLVGTLMDKLLNVRMRAPSRSDVVEGVWWGVSSVIAAGSRRD